MSDRGYLLLVVAIIKQFQRDLIAADKLPPEWSRDVEVTSQSPEWRDWVDAWADVVNSRREREF